MPSRAARRFSVCAVLSPGVSHFRSFSLVYAVNFAVSIFCLWLLNCGLFGLQMASHYFDSFLFSCNSAFDAISNVVYR